MLKRRHKAPRHTMMGQLGVQATPPQIKHEKSGLDKLVLNIVSKKRRMQFFPFQHKCEFLAS